MSVTNKRSSKAARIKTAIGSMSIAMTSLWGLQAAAHDGGFNRPDFWRRLQGDYGLTAQQSCVRTPFQLPGAAGFDRTTGQLLTTATVADAAGSGIMHFDRDGTVDVEVLGIELETNKVQPGDVPVSSGIQYACKGTYTVTSDSRISVSFPACNVSPPRPGLTVTVGPLELQGFVGRGREGMVLSAVKGNVETVSIAAGGNVVSQRERICVGSYSLEKIGGGD